MPIDFFETTIKILVLCFVAGGLWVGFSAFSMWLRRQERSAEAGDPRELTELRETVQRLSADVAELQERVDFTERVLSQQREGGRLAGGG